MTVMSVEASAGHRVLVHFCACGAWAAFGRGVHVRLAIARRDVALMGEWTCGPDGCVGRGRGAA